MNEFRKNSYFDKSESAERQEAFREALRMGRVEQLTQGGPDPTPPVPKPKKEAASPDMEQWNYLLNEALGHFANGNQGEGVSLVEQVRDEIYRGLR